MIVVVYDAKIFKSVSSMRRKNKDRFLFGHVRRARALCVVIQFRFFEEEEMTSSDIKWTSSGRFRSGAVEQDVGLVKGTPQTTDCHTRLAVRVGWVEQTLGGIKAD
jgi:hypothetical protein